MYTLHPITYPVFMKTSRVMQCSRIFPLILILTLSGCGGEGSGGAGSEKLSDARCAELDKLMQEFADIAVNAQVEAMTNTREGIEDLDAGYDVDADAVAAESDELMQQAKDATDLLKLYGEKFESGQCKSKE